MVAFAKTTLKARHATSGANPDPKALDAISKELTGKLTAFEKTIDQFAANTAYKTLVSINTQCGKMNAAMIVPYVGTAVAGLCGKVAALDIRLAGLKQHADAHLANGMTAKERLFDKMNAMQAGAQGGMPMQGNMMQPVMMPMQNQMQQNMPINGPMNAQQAQVPPANTDDNNDG